MIRIPRELHCLESWESILDESSQSEGEKKVTETDQDYKPMFPDLKKDVLHALNKERDEGSNSIETKDASDTNGFNKRVLPLKGMTRTIKNIEFMKEFLSKYSKDVNATMNLNEKKRIGYSKITSYDPKNSRLYYDRERKKIFYVGELKDFLPEGKGKFYTNSQVFLYEGEWENGFPQGEGKLHFVENGKTVKCIWESINKVKIYNK